MLAMNCFIVGITGCSGCGKTNLAENLSFRFLSCKVISLDSFYKTDVDRDAIVSWEDPSLIDWNEAEKEIRNARERHKMLIVEGFCMLHCEEVRKLLDVTVGVVIEKDVALQRRMKRDEQVWNDKASTESYFEDYVWKEHCKYEEKYKDLYDFTVDSSKETMKAMTGKTEQFVRDTLKRKGITK